MSAREFDEWFAAYTIEPWGEHRADLRAAMQTSPLVNIHIPKDQRSKATSPADFMPDFWQPPTQTAEPMTADATADMLAAMLGGTKQKPVA